jgi:hypothetical protein
MNEYTKEQLTDMLNKEKALNAELTAQIYKLQSLSVNIVLAQPV